MDTIRDAYVELIRTHEAASLAHAAAVEQHAKDRSRGSHLTVLQMGASASHAGGKLEGFTMALALLASRVPWDAATESA